MSEAAPDNVLYEAHPPMFRNHPFWFVLSLLLVPVAVGIVILLIWYLTSRARKITITHQELRYEEGLLSKSRIELKLSSIRSVRIYQSLFQRMFGTGDIQVFTAGDSPEIIAKGLPDPHRIRELTG